MAGTQHPNHFLFVPLVRLEKKEGSSCVGKKWCLGHYHLIITMVYGKNFQLEFSIGVSIGLTQHTGLLQEFLKQVITHYLGRGTDLFTRLLLFFSLDNLREKRSVPLTK